MISPTEELHWRTKGWIVPECQIEDTKSLLSDIKNYYHGKDIVPDFGTEKDLMFPSKIDSINKIATNKILIAMAGQLLNTAPRLIQMVAWAKKCSNTHDSLSNDDQRMHMDYGNNSFVHPPPFNNPNVASCILYLSNTEETGGGTAIVPRRGPSDKWYTSPYVSMPGQAGYEFINNKQDAETMMLYEGCDRSELYEREITPEYEIGDILWYRHDVWHRGTPVKSGKVRYVINLAWTRADTPILCWNMGFAQQMYYGWLETFISTLNAYQLYSIGFPHPLSSYWCKETINGTQARYKCYGFDIEKYLKATII